MVRLTRPPPRLRLEVRDHERPAVAVEVRGDWAAIRSRGPLGVDDAVRLHLDWASGAVTTLPARVRSVLARPEGDTLARVEVTGVEGDWREFLAYVGSRAVRR